MAHANISGAGDPHNLSRFVEAQEQEYAQALSEIRQGRKQSHWMWYIFPQIDGLGFSATSRRYSIKSRAEAEAYLRHPVLGPRLIECAEAALGVEGRSAFEIFGSPDDMKFYSSMSLFVLAASDRAGPCRTALDRWWRGEADPETLRLLGLRDV